DVVDAVAAAVGSAKRGQVDHVVSRRIIVRDRLRTSTIRHGGEQHAGADHESRNADSHRNLLREKRRRIVHEPPLVLLSRTSGRRLSRSLGGPSAPTAM